MTDARIPLDELKYWSVDLQEAYAIPTAVLQRHFPGALKALGLSRTCSVRAEFLLARLEQPLGHELPQSAPHPRTPASPRTARYRAPRPAAPRRRAAAPDPFPSSPASAPSRLASATSASISLLRKRMMIGEGALARPPRCRWRAASGKTGRDRRCRQTPARACRASAASDAASGFRCARQHRLAPRGDRGRDRRRPRCRRRSRSARRCGRVAAAAARATDRRETRWPLPRPRSPSITISEASLAIAGFWKPSSIRITLAPCDRASATPSMRSRATTTGNRPRHHQRLVADIGRSMPRGIDLDRPAQSAAIAAAEHHRRLAEFAQQLRQRQHRRGLAGAADVIIADAKHGDAGVEPLALQSLAPRPGRRARRAASAIAISMMTADTRRPAHALAAPISSRNCNRYGSSAASVRSSAPPSCSTTRSAAATDDLARRGIGQQLAELLHQRFLAYRPAGRRRRCRALHRRR